MGGIPSAGVRRNGGWTPPPFFGGGVGPTATRVETCILITDHTFILYRTMLILCHLSQ